VSANGEGVSANGEEVNEPDDHPETVVGKETSIVVEVENDDAEASESDGAEENGMAGVIVSENGDEEESDCEEEDLDEEMVDELV